MKLQLIRNATLLLDYAGHRLLIDPFFAAKGTLQPFATGENNPTADMPMPAAAVIEGVELILVSHLHTDHFDDTAVAALPTELPLFCQPEDLPKIQDKGFVNLRSLLMPIEWEGISIQRMPGQHGTGSWARRLGPVSGFLFRAAGQPTVYWAGDTVLYGSIEGILERHQPDIIVTHSGGAQFPTSGPIIMDIPQTLRVAELAPNATVIATHMEALDHCPVTRAELRRAADEMGITHERLRIPADGESIEL